MPRIEHVTGDGRTYLMRSGRQFDIIEADALRPTSAFSGNVYSIGLLHAGAIPPRARRASR